MLRPRTSLESRIAYETGIRNRYTDRSYPWTEADFSVFSPENEPEVLPAYDGQVFDLGGRVLTACLVPGHSPGSMALIDSKTGTLFAGDCINCNIGMGISPAGTGEKVVRVSDGLRYLRQLWAKDFDHNRIFNGHPDFRAAGTPLAENVLPTAITALEEILDGAPAEQVYQPTLSKYVNVYRKDPVMIRFDPDNL